MIDVSKTRESMINSCQKSMTEEKLRKKQTMKFWEEENGKYKRGEGRS